MSDFNELRDGLYDLNRDGELDDFERNVQLDDYERNVKLDSYLGAYENDSGNTYIHHSGKKGTAFLVIALIVLCIPGWTLMGLLLLYLWWIFYKVC